MVKPESAPPRRLRQPYKGPEYAIAIFRALRGEMYPRCSYAVECMLRSTYYPAPTGTAIKGTRHRESTVSFATQLPALPTPRGGGLC